MVLSEEQCQSLKLLASRYVWWQPAEQSLAQPHRLLAQVMNIGDWHDVEMMRGSVGDETLRVVLQKAQPGEFNKRSWNFWHLCLNLASGSDLPPLPRRRLP